MFIHDCNVDKNQLALKEYILIRNRAAIITLLAVAILAALSPITFHSSSFTQSLEGMVFVYSLTTLTTLALFSLLSTLYKIYFISLQLQQQKAIQLPPAAVQAEIVVAELPQDLNPLDEEIAEIAAAPLAREEVEEMPPQLDPIAKNLADYTKILTLIRNQLAPFLIRLSGDNTTRNLFFNLMDHIIADLPHLSQIRQEIIILNERRIEPDEGNMPLPIIADQIALLGQALDDDEIDECNQASEALKLALKKMATELPGREAALLNFPPFPIQPLAEIPRNRFVYLAHIFRLLMIGIPLGKEYYEYKLNNLEAPERLAIKTALNQPNAAKKGFINLAIDKGLTEIALTFPNGLRSHADPNFDYIKTGSEFIRTLISNVIDKYFNVTEWTKTFIPVPIPGSGFGLSDSAFDDLNLFIPILNNLSNVALELAGQQEPYTQEQLSQAILDAAITPLNRTLWR